MKIIDQSAVYLPHQGNPYEFIEDVGRTCYKSEKRGNPVGFVKGLAKSKHLAMLEHWYVYFKLNNIARVNFWEQMDPMLLKYLNVNSNYVSGSFRAFLELGEQFDCPEIIDYTCDDMIIIEMIRQLCVEYPDIFTFNFESCNLKSSKGSVELMTRKEFINDVRSVGYVDMIEDSILKQLLPHTVRFVTNRGVSHEIVRHRPASYAQESQRYVGYDKEKFGSEITVIKPLLDPDSKDYEEWKYAMDWCETVYKNLRSRDITPQIARGVLPNDCKTEIVVTATEEEWQHIMNLRYHGTTGTPHPQIKELMGIIYPTLTVMSEGRIK